MHNAVVYIAVDQRVEEIHKKTHKNPTTIIIFSCVVRRLV